VTYLKPPPSVEAEQFLAMLRVAPAHRNKLSELSRNVMEVQNGSTTFHDGAAGMVLFEHLPVKAAAVLFGYHQSYLQRLLRTGRLEGIKIGQAWPTEETLCRDRLPEEQHLSTEQARDQAHDQDGGE